MVYSFNGKIENLVVFYKSMCQMKVQIAAFTHIYNGVISDVIVDTRNE